MPLYELPLDIYDTICIDVYIRQQKPEALQQMNIEMHDSLAVTNILVKTFSNSQHNTAQWYKRVDFTQSPAILLYITINFNLKNIITIFII